MPNWDENSPELKANLSKTLRIARDGAKTRESPSLDLPRKWQAQIMEGLTPPDKADQSWYGKYRGEAGQEHIAVEIGPSHGTPPQLVSKELQDFIASVQKAIETYDAQIFRSEEDGTVSLKELDHNAILSVIGLMAYVHGAWIRIHPFANGNGRTARLWANWIAMRYGLPPFIALRPRPRQGYEWASYMAMNGNWQVMRPVFEQMFDEMATDFFQ